MPVGKTIVSSARWLPICLILSIASGQSPEAPIKTVRISGMVLDMSGAPASYEAVYLRLAGTQDFLASVPTDGDGTFAFAQVPANRYELVVQPPYYTPTLRTVDTSEGTNVDVGTLHLTFSSLCDQAPVSAPRRRTLHFLHPEKTYRVSGRIVDTLGVPVGSAQVVLLDSCTGFGAKTDEFGTFQILRVWPTDYLFQVKGPGFLPVVQPIVVGNRKKDTDLGTVVVRR